MDVSLEGLTTIHCCVLFLFILSYLFLFDYTCLFLVLCYDANQVAKASQDLLSTHGGPMTRSRTKKMKDSLNGLIEHISNLDFVQDYNLPESIIQEDPCFVNVIQAS